MADMRVDNVLAQIRNIRQQTAPVSPELDMRGPQPLDGVKPQPRVDFGTMLQNSLNEVNALQQKSGATAAAYERGDQNVTLTEVMVNMQKADVAMKATVEVRNKFVDAYHEIMRMSI